MRPIILSFCILVAAAGSALAEPIFPSGSNWGIEPPPDFEVISGQTGFMNATTGSVIMFQDLPVPADKREEMSAVKLADAMAGNADFEIAERREFDNGTLQGRSLSGRYNDGTQDMLMHLLLVDGPESIGQAMVFVHPRSRGNEEMEAVSATLQSLRYRAQTLEGRIAALPFSFAELGGMRVYTTYMTGGSLAMLTAGPTDTDDPLLQPHMSVFYGPLRGELPEETWEQAARDMLVERDDRAQIGSVVRTAVGGLDGVRLDAMSTGGDGATPTAIRQWILLDDNDHFFFVVAATRADRAETDLPLFDEVLDGIRRR